MTTTDRELVELQETLYTSTNPTRRWLHCTRRDWILDALSRVGHGPGGTRLGRVLEVGPGSGLYLPVLAELADEVVGSDVEAAYLDNLRHLEDHPRIRLVLDDMTASALPTGHVDLVLCTEVIEHIRDSRAALAEMHRILRPGGVLVLSTPQRYSPLEVCAKVAFLPGVISLVRRIYGEPIIETGHINLMRRSELHRQVGDAGFEITATHTSGLYLPVLAEAGGERALRLEQRLERRARGTRFEGLLWTQYVIAHA